MTYAEHGIRRYHAITAQDQQQKDHGWNLLKNLFKLS